MLDSYAELLGEDGSQILRTDVAIEMPAGTGKTLVALLISEKHRRLGRSIALLTGTKQLASQVNEEVQGCAQPMCYGLNVCFQRLGVVGFTFGWTALSHNSSFCHIARFSSLSELAQMSLKIRPERQRRCDVPIETTENSNARFSGL